MAFALANRAYQFLITIHLDLRLFYKLFHKNKNHEIRGSSSFLKNDGFLTFFKNSKNRQKV